MVTALRWLNAAPWLLVGRIVGALWCALGWQVGSEVGQLARVIVSRGPVAAFFRGRGWSAFTIGATVLCWRTPSPQLILHELEHVRQWRRWGLAFPFAYAYELVRRGYRNNRFEVAAREAAKS